jgi:predicted DCC family thiol-disulfide oxidoreductase YuxK
MPTIVFYDGLCGLCDASVQWILRRDRQKAFVFAPLQGETAQRHGVATTEPDPTSMVVVVPGEGAALEASDAVLAVVARLGFPWSVFTIGRILPRRIRDAMYGWLARNRYRISRRLEACRLPTEEERERFLP